MKLWPFITKRVYLLHGERVVWLSRMHRKGLLPRDRMHVPTDVPFWKTQSYNGYIGVSFAIGAALFAVASVLLYYSIGNPELTNLTNITYFLGSIPFTVAASLQHFQSANAPTFVGDAKTPTLADRIKLIGWQPRSPGWWSTFSQWVGTIAFNISTFNAIHTPDAKVLVALEIWGPNFEGSILFLISGYLGFIEVSDKYWSWRPHSLAWRIVFVNFLGCVAFMIAAVAPSTTTGVGTLDWLLTYSDTYTLIGAVFFLIGSLMLVHESKQAIA